MGEIHKPTLLHFRQKAGLTTKQLAQEAGVSHTKAYMVEIGGFVEREVAEKVLTAFSKLSGTTLHLDDIRYQTISHLQPPSQKAREHLQ